jgi:esterase FrsA
MSYQWSVDVEDLFKERSLQMVNTGLSAVDVEATRLAIEGMWPDEPGGWVYEWSKLGGAYAADGRHDLAVLAYGWAKFPVLADESKRTAFKRQLEQYELASPGFPVSFERRLLEVSYEDTTLKLPVHILSAPDIPEDAPVIVASGGVDSWKMDLHLLFSQLSLLSGTRVLLFDIPGTGETDIPLSAAAPQILDGLFDAARRMGNGKVVHLGISMGGYFSAYSGLKSKVDASIVVGGPVDASFAPTRHWKFGMADILGNALGFENQPTAHELSTRCATLSLRSLLDQEENAPMLVINGADDIHVPQEDTLVFEGRKDTRVELLPDTGHCATSKFPEVMAVIVAWTGQQLG